MPLFHCVKCHHEWEGIREKLVPICDWCGAHGYIIEESTPLETMCDEIKKVGVKKFFEEIGLEVRDVGNDKI